MHAAAVLAGGAIGVDDLRMKSRDSAGALEVSIAKTFIPPRRPTRLTRLTRTTRTTRVYSAVMFESFTRRRLFKSLAAGLAGASVSTNRAGAGVRQDAAPPAGKGSLLLSEFEPRSMLHVKETQVEARAFRSSTCIRISRSAPSERRCRAGRGDAHIPARRATARP